MPLLKEQGKLALPALLRYDELAFRQSIFDSISMCRNSAYRSEAFSIQAVVALILSGFHKKKHSRHFIAIA